MAGAGAGGGSYHPCPRVGQPARRSPRQPGTNELARDLLNAAPPMRRRPALPTAASFVALALFTIGCQHAEPPAVGAARAALTGTGALPRATDFASGNNGVLPLGLATG